MIDAIRGEVGKVIVGQHGVLAGFLAALLADGHVLLEGVPGVAKTLLVKAVAASIDVEMTRIQFTPDLMPSDVTGQLMYGQDTGKFTFRKGPVFTNLLLADEINRTPPKTQAALLEVMEERQVTVFGERHRLPHPFMVIATQNPIEYEGTYPLPEAQLDRFLAKIYIGYPEPESEREVLARHHRGLNLHEVTANGVRAVASPADLDRARGEVHAVQVEDSILTYITELVRATRSSPVVDLGVSPRGGVALLGLSKAWAWMSGRDFVTPDDVKAIAKPSLRHRLHVQPEAELEGVTPDIVLDGLLDTVPVPR
jgi:MoxR-like ATPase